ncbi:RidA family protein [Nonomuraea basaltis]|uniref:RidA family protein n=1 Tax=Nonomuraea basaltis TaxID=2495887 RepID=UPI00110C4BC4|nr:RidA family protein [Nonomuraea basaltis]TMR96565.1 RidA family protein [Nonomuraea basaltis]
MSRTAHSTASAPAPRGHYSQVVTSGDLVVTAGFGPVDPVSRTIVGEDIQEQTRQTLRNVMAALEAAGCGMQDVVKVTAHLADADRDWEGFDAVFPEFFDPPYPVRTTAGSSLGDILVEIDVLARRNPAA